MAIARPPRFGLDFSRAPRVVQASLEPIIRFFSYHDAHPVALGMVLFEKFGNDWVEWEAEALKHEIIQAFRASGVSDHNWQKIQAFRTLMSTTLPFEEWDAFENVVLAFNNVVPIVDVVQMCSMAQLFAGVDIIRQVRDDEPFGSDVAGYVAACALEEGVTYLPDPLDFASELLAEPMYKCMDCGMTNRLEGGVTEDGRCDYCCERYRDGQEFDGKPNPRLPKDCGTNVTKFELRPAGNVPKLFDKWKGEESVEPDPSDPTDVQAAKLVVAHKYMLLRREQLVEQLKELKSWVTH